jgi:hypothetical protein
MNKQILAVVIIVIIGYSGFGIGAFYLSTQQPGLPANTNSQPTNSPVGPTAQPTSAIVVGNVVRYKTASYIDNEGIGTKAFSLLIPSDWQFEGTVVWNLDNTLMPASAYIRTWSPSGNEEFDVFPNQAFYWTDNPLVQQTNPPGSTYFGAMVSAPLGPIEALKQVVLPTFRSNVENVNVVSEQLLPSMDQLFKTGTDPASGISYSVNSGKIRVEYSLNGVAMEDEMYCVIQSINIPLQSIYGTTTSSNWYMSYLASFRAEKGQLDSESKVFQTIAYSCSIDKNWLNKYNQLVAYLIQNQIKQIQSAGQLSNILAQTSDQISQENLQDWEQRQSVNDRLTTDFCNQILEIQPYSNPIDGTTVDLPSGYNNAWVNGNGEYILADNPNFNPNIESNSNWQPMTIAGG